jgi:hypothetical protein
VSLRYVNRRRARKPPPPRAPAPLVVGGGSVVDGSARYRALIRVTRARCDAVAPGDDDARRARQIRHGDDSVPALRRAAAIQRDASRWTLTRADHALLAGLEAALCRARWRRSRHPTRVAEQAFTTTYSPSSRC